MIDIEDLIKKDRTIVMNESKNRLEIKAKRIEVDDNIIIIQHYNTDLITTLNLNDIRGLYVFQIDDDSIIIGIVIKNDRSD